MPHFQKHGSWDVQEATGNLITAEASRQQAVKEKHGSSGQPYISCALQGCIYVIKITLKQSYCEILLQFKKTVSHYNIS